MKGIVRTMPRSMFACLCVAGAVSLAACSKADDAGKAAQAAPSSQASTPAPDAPPPPATDEAADWSPSALDELLAPIALYPDAILAQVLAASTNSQEVLDAGNWLLDNQSLQGDALTKAAADADFSPSVQSLVHFPTVVDMMCREIDWTRQVGDAFTADQGAVLASVQRLRAQAAEVGNLKSTPEMAVSTETQQDKQVIVIQPANPQVVYVPQYNPTQAYTAPPPATTMTTTTSDSGITTSEAVMGGLLAFGAGILVGNMWNDNDHDCYPNWGYGGVYYGPRPYYPHNTFVYAPRYPGYRPTPYYRPPANYQNRYNNYNKYGRTNVNVSNNAYFNRFDKNQNRVSNYQPRSPIASPTTANRGDYRGQTTYKGADRPRPTGGTATTREAQPRPSGTYQGARGPATQPSAGQRNQPQTGARQPTQRPEVTQSQRPGKGVDRGYPQTSGKRPDASSATQDRGARSFSGAGENRGSVDRAASERGRSSMKAAPRPSSSQHGQRSGGGSRRG